MRRISTSIALALSTLLLVSICSAQPTATGNPANPAKSGLGIDTVVNCAIAANNYIPVFTAVLPPNITVCNSAIYQDSTGKVGVGNTTPAVKLDVSGHINTSQSYRIGGSTVLSIGSAADQNLFVGVGAGVDNVAGSGVDNMFSGYQAGYNNNTGVFNTFSGSQAGNGNTNGQANTFTGFSAGYNNNTGFNNTFSGFQAGNGNTSGADNTFTGWGAGYSIPTGNGNTFIGFQAGASNVSGNNNIYVGNSGCSSPCTEDDTIRIGGDDGLSYGPQTKTFIVGIYGSTSSGGIAVYINSNGRLGTMTSSLRFKEQVRDMGDSTSPLMKLRPVTFLYKPEYAEGERTMQYGLIAEEVAKVYPELVVYDKDDQPYAVRYQYLSTMLLNEVQKQAAVIHSQQQEIESLKRQLQGQNASLQERLARLEKLAENQPQTVATKEVR